jgi:hypothetical protein
VEGPIGGKEALGFKREGLRVGRGVMKHTPNEDKGQNYRLATDFNMHTMRLRLQWHLHLLDVSLTYSWMNNQG